MVYNPKVDLALNPPQHSYIYNFKYDYHNTELCKLESRQLFGDELRDQLLFSNIKVDPSISPFIRNRFEIILSADGYFELLQSIMQENIHHDGFKVAYLTLNGDETPYPDRLEKLMDVGYRIEGVADYKTPSITYAICQQENTWYFGVLIKHNPDWNKHMKKPCSFSNSINMDIAKTLVSIASKGDKSIRLLDACCGVGTVMLEACCTGFHIEGCDINWKAYKHSKENLAHYNYSAEVHRSDIKDLVKKYDAIIIDLPYNLYSYSNDDIALNIITSAANLSARIVVVSVADIQPLLKKSGLKITDFCKVEKKGKSKFTRTIWVCEHDGKSG